MTANSFTAVCTGSAFDSCVREEEARMLPVLKKAQRFGVSILRDNQRAISELPRSRNKTPTSSAPWAFAFSGPLPASPCWPTLSSSWGAPWWVLISPATTPFFWVKSNQPRSSKDEPLLFFAERTAASVPFRPARPIFSNFPSGGRRGDRASPHTARPIYPSSVRESPTIPEKISAASLLLVFQPLVPSAISRQIVRESTACARTGISETTRRIRPAPRPPRKRRRAYSVS